MAKLQARPKLGRGVYDVRLWGPRADDGKRTNEFRRFQGERRAVQKQADAWEAEVRATWARGSSPALTLAAFWQGRIDAGCWTKAKTVQDKVTHLKWATEDGFADRPLVDITPDDVQDHLRWFEARPAAQAKRNPDGTVPTMSPTTVMQHRGAVREMLRAATVENVVTGAPALVRSPAELATVTRRPTKRTRTRLPVVGDVNAGLVAPRHLRTRQGSDFVGEWPSWFQLIVALAMATGMRRGEMVGLQWGDVERHADGSAHLHIERQVTNRTTTQRDAGFPPLIVSPALKTENSYRAVKVPAAFVEFLDAFRLGVEAVAMTNGIEPGTADWPTAADRFIFTTNWDTPLSPAKVTEWWGKLRRAVGFPASFRLHDLRHLHATDLLGHGLAVTDVAARLGNTPKTVIESYVHATQEGEDRAVEIVGGLLYGT